MTPPAQPPAPRPRITWKVGDRFRLFDETNPAVVSKAEGILARLADGPIADQYDFLAQQLRADAKGAAPFLFENTHFDRTAGTYSIAYVQPRSQRVIATLEGAGPGDVNCVWKVDGAAVTTQPCATPFTFDLALDQTTFLGKGVVSVQTSAATTTVDPVEVVTQDRLVLGLGDSYASGEGNPDRPADLGKVTANWPPGYLRATDWWRPTPLGANVLPASASAQWWSNECHRSLFSPQVLTAMKLAAADLHRSVTFVSFACSGAATLDGLVAPQRSPPGEDRAPGPAHAVSQLEQAVQALCAEPPGRQPLPYRPTDYQVWQGIYEKTYGAEAAPSYPTCPNGAWRRKPDLIFLTLGGNDIGFAGLGAWALLPQTLANADAINVLAGALFNGGLVFVCPTVPFEYPVAGNQVRDLRCERGAYSGNEGAKRLTEDELPGLYQLAADGLSESGLAPDPTKVIQQAYPAPFNDAQGRACGVLAPGSEFTSTADLEQVWKALDVLLVSDRLAPSVSQVKTQTLADDVLPGLDQQIEESAKVTHWQVAAAPPQYVTHGFCAGSGNLVGDFGFPQVKLAYKPIRLFSLSIGPPLYRGAWDPDSFPPTGAPSDWDPYKSRARWLRVANDSLLTEMVGGASGSISLESLVGMLHPTAEGEVVIADELAAAVPAAFLAPSTDDAPASATKP